MGGWSAEREVSLRSGKACADALERTGRYKVSRVDVDRDIAVTLRALKPDCALNVLHGRPGEDGTLQGMLEILGIPYSHSGVMASAVAIQKDIAKTVLKAAGVPVPGGMAVSRTEAAKAHLLPPPYVIKPVAEGSSVGVFIVREDHAHPPQELTRAGLEVRREGAGRALHRRQGAHLRGDGRQSARRHRDRRRPPSSTTTKPNTRPAARSIWCRRRSRPRSTRPAAAWRWPRTTRSPAAASPAPISATTISSRVSTGLACLEVNTQPGMTETSLVPELAAHAGIPFEELVSWMVEDASLDR